MGRGFESHRGHFHFADGYQDSHVSYFSIVGSESVIGHISVTFVFALASESMYRADPPPRVACLVAHENTRPS